MCRRVLLVAPLLLALIMPPVALCVGGDGHVEVEIFDATCCNSAQVDEDCTDGCTDSDLGLRAASTQVDRRDVVAAMHQDAIVATPLMRLRSPVFARLAPARVAARPLPLPPLLSPVRLC